MAIAFYQTKEVFIVYMAYLNSKILICLAYKAQIILLIAKKNIFLAEYLDFVLK